MLKKSVAIIILLGLLLHGAGRAGLLSYLYSHRQDIAYSLGLVDEPVITTCSGDHFQHYLLVITPENKSIPVSLLQSHEIVLDVPPSYFSLAGKFQFQNRPVSFYHLAYFPSLTEDIFHPPGCLS